MFPSRPIDWLTRASVLETVRYETTADPVTTELYRPPGRGPHPAVVVCQPFMTSGRARLLARKSPPKVLMKTGRTARQVGPNGTRCTHQLALRFDDAAIRSSGCSGKR